MASTPASVIQQPLHIPGTSMRALEWYGVKDVRIATKPIPAVTENYDAVIRITSTTICGSDLHLYHNSIPAMMKGDILGHECMGIVVDTGSQVKNVMPGDRVVVSAVISCGSCEFCKKGMFSLCDTTNPSVAQEEEFGGHRTAGIFGYSHLMGGYPGGQAEYIRVPFADVNCLKVPNSLSDEKVLFLSDVICTAWHAVELGEVCAGKTVAVWGCGPVGLMSLAWCKYRGASRLVAIDNVPYRLGMAYRLFGCEIIDFNSVDPRKAITNMLPGGPDVSIDAVGFRYAKSWKHTLEKFLHIETDSIDSLSEAIYATKKGGIVVPIGDYIGTANHFPIGALMEKGLTIRSSQVPVQKYWKDLLQKIEKGEIDPTFLVSHVMPLEKAPEAYDMFDKKESDVMKVILKPIMPEMGATPNIF